MVYVCFPVYLPRDLILHCPAYVSTLLHKSHYMLQFLWSHSLPPSYPTEQVKMSTQAARPLTPAPPLLNLCCWNQSTENLGEKRIFLQKRIYFFCSSCINAKGVICFTCAENVKIIVTIWKAKKSIIFNKMSNIQFV